MRGSFAAVMVGAPALALALGGGCGPFDADSESALDAGNERDELDARSMAADSGPSCRTAIDDAFDRDSVIGGPWLGLVASDPSRIKISNGELSVETQMGNAVEQLTLTTGPFPPPRRLTCTFRFTPRSGFDSTPHTAPLPIDLFVLALTYPDKTQTLVRFSYAENALSVRDDHFDAQGRCVDCPADRGTAPFPMVKDTPVDLTVDVQDDTSFFKHEDSVIATRQVSLGEPSSAEILFGLWSYSDRAQQGVLDDLHCQLDCP